MTEPTTHLPETLPAHGGLSSLFVSLAVIIVSEIGDKTFIIAAVLAMRHSRLLVFSAAISALGIMTLLSALAGSLFPTLISKVYTQFLVSILFLFFGARMFQEGRSMTGKEAQEELDEVTIELEKKEKDEDGNTVEMGLLGQDHPDPASPHGTHALAQKILLWILSPVWIEAFVMTFLAEWGDRSQIATIALAGAEDFWYVSIGSILGHALCSGIAVMGGRLLAARISVKSVTLLGAGLFIIFGVASLYSILLGSDLP